MMLKLHFRFLRSGEDRSTVAETHPRTRWNWVSFVLTAFRQTRAVALAVARRIRSTRLGRLHWLRGSLYSIICTTVITVALVAAGYLHVYF